MFYLCKKFFLISIFMLFLLLLMSGLTLADDLINVNSDNLKNLSLIYQSIMTNPLQFFLNEYDGDIFLYQEGFLKKTVYYYYYCIYDILSQNNFYIANVFLNQIDYDRKKSAEEIKKNKLIQTQLDLPWVWPDEYIVVLQFGKGNLIHQAHNVYKNYLEAVQKGNYNSANQIQNGISWWYWDGLYDDARSHQYGFYNFANQIQYGCGNYAMNYQEGDFNYTEQKQTGDFISFGLGGFNTAIAEQNGSWNYINQIQNGDMNYAIAYQHGKDNRSEQYQFSFMNYSYIYQNGSLHFAYIRQR